MSEWKLNHFTDLGHLLTASTNVIIANLLSIVLIVTIDGLSLIKQGGLVSDNSILRWVHIDDLELYGAESTPHNEGVVLLDWTECVLEVWDQVGRCDATRDVLNCISKWKHMDLGCVWYICWHWMDLDDVSHAHTQVSSNNLVDVDAFVFSIWRGCWVSVQSNANCFLSLLSCCIDKVMISMRH